MGGKRSGRNACMAGASFAASTAVTRTSGCLGSQSPAANCRSGPTRTKFPPPRPTMVSAVDLFLHKIGSFVLACLLAFLLAYLLSFLLAFFLSFSFCGSYPRPSVLFLVALTGLSLLCSSSFTCLLLPWSSRSSSAASRKYFKEKAKVNFKAIDEERVENTDADTNDNQKQSSDA